MKPIVVNRHGRMFFPYNFFPVLDFSVFVPNPDGAGALLEAVDLVVPHQANKTMVVHYRVGNTSSASIPLAIYDAVDPAIVAR
jgi:3-oxoacyl-[acyl-carrier-protein] synthase III